MITARRALAAGLVVLGALGLSACTTGQTEPEESLDGTTQAEVSASGSAPIVFAFVCSTDAGEATETFTTYAAAWEAERADCTAKPITGSGMSAQQQAAVRATDDHVDLRELAATCAERGVAPWDTAVTTDEQAHLAAGLLEYCPGHPEHDHLRRALATYRG
ncbi:hypothetical protein [Curtobacterium sp. ER1/6]|uniref:hypothetical protein n=1 Tax=Curtobacterium sp. ER1/6 TaxID=1891920 RepID=UPI00084FB75A|nr:hypothetical protein [Curtobacterium sp. ER1/6]OEI69994.1 hypothetical protein Cus16_0614 [Curtobacterium sp. ER1/6]